MNNQPLISVVLPTYNVAQYLQQCLASVAAQTYRNIEVIIIVDGATDGSYEIAKEFCQTDDRFAVYWQENAGSGPARNAGLERCRGELVMFVDPDDWIEPDLLEHLYESQQVGDYDLVASRRTLMLYGTDGRLIERRPKHYADEVIVGEREVREAFMRMVQLSVVSDPTQKLFKLSLIRERRVEFPSLRRSQDIVFNYRYYDCIRSLRLISYSGYNYRMIDENNVWKVKPDYYKTILLLHQGYAALYQKWALPFPEQEMAGWFFSVRIYSYLLKMAAQKQDYTEAVEHPVIRQIISSAQPKIFYHRIVRRLLLARQYKTLQQFLTLIVMAKRVSK